MKTLGQVSLQVIKILTVYVLCYILISGSAFAQGQGKKLTVGELLKRAQEESRGGKGKDVININKSNVQLPSSKMQFQDQQKHNLEAIKPPRGSDILRNDRRSGESLDEYEQILDRQTQEAFKLTKKFVNSPNRGELWLRLAELYVEKSGLVDTRLQDKYDKELQAFQAGTRKVKPRLNLQEAREYNRKAIQLYEWFQRDFPNDEKMSQALFFLGYNYFELGDTKKGSAYYHELTSRYPNSPFVGEAKFALGEYYFENEKWADAYREYTYLIKDKKHRLHLFSLYKGAWCLYRTGKTQQGIKYLDYIIKLGRGEVGQDAGNKRTMSKSRLESEAIRDMVVFYADIGDPKKAYAYFNALTNEKEATNYVEKLGFYYADKGNREASRDVFLVLMQKNPDSPKAFEYQYQIVQNYFYAKNSPQFKEEVYKWIRDFGPSSSWAAKNASNTELMANAYKLQEQTLRTYTLQQHQTAQNSRAPFSQKLASESYALYLQEFKSTEQYKEMMFYYGELLYEMGQYKDATRQYQWVVDNAPESKFYARAAQSLLLTADKQVPPDNELQKKVGQSVEKIPMDPAVAKFVEVAVWYLQKFPNTDKDLEIRFRLGRIYYQHNHFTEASEIFKGIVQKYPKTKQAEYSANLLLDIYNLQKDYSSLEKVGAELLANESIASSKAGSDIRGVLEKASFKRGQDLETEKKYKESAEQFQVFSKQNPTSNLAVVALFNAAVNYERAGLYAPAVQNYTAVLASNKPEAENLKPKARRLIAKLNQDAGLFEEAARMYKLAAQENKKDPLVPNYLFNAAVMTEVLGRSSEAIKLYLEFISVNKKNDENVDAIFTIAEIHRKANQLTGAIYRYKEYISYSPRNQNKILESHYWIATLSKKQGKTSDYEEHKNKTIQLQKRLARDSKSVGVKYVAQLKFDDAEVTYREYKNVKIPSNPAKQKAAVDRKIELLGRMNSQLTEIIKMDSAEEIVSALNLNGEANLNMYEEIINTPLPPGLSEEQKKQYKAGVDGIAQPFLTKAKDSFKLAVERGMDLEVYSSEYQNSYARLSKLNPNVYYNGSEMASDSRLINWMGQ